MQAELLLRDMEPPSYEESIDVKQMLSQIKAQRRKTPPPSYEKNSVFDVFRHIQLLDNKSITPSVIGKTITESPNEKCHDDETEKDPPMDERLERVSSCLQQMIDAANQSLTSDSTTQPLSMEPDTFDNDTTSQDDLLKEQKKKNQQWRINRKKSLERLKSSQDSLARTIDQLNLSITQHITNEAASSTYDYTQYHHHHHQHLHHHHHHHQYQINSPKRHRQQSMIPLWTNVLTQAALVFGICHQLLSWSTPTSSILSVAWLLTRLLAKKKINHNNSGFVTLKLSPTSSSSPSPSEYSTKITTMVSFYSQLKSSLVPRYSTVLSIFRKQ